MPKCRPWHRSVGGVKQFLQKLVGLAPILQPSERAGGAFHATERDKPGRAEPEEERQRSGEKDPPEIADEVARVDEKLVDVREALVQHRFVNGREHWNNLPQPDKDGCNRVIV